MPQQEAFTAIADIRPGAGESLERLLAVIGKDPAQNTVLPFGALPNVHFARLLVLPESVDLDGGVIPAKLVISTNVDGSVRQHVRDLAHAVPEGLDQVFGHCEGYPAGDAARDADRVAFLEQRMVQANAFYVNTVGRTLERIHQEDQLREALQDFLDCEGTKRDLREMTPSSLHALLRKHVGDEPDLAWALKPASGLSLRVKLRRTAGKIGWPIVFAAVGLAFIPLLPFYVIGLRRRETADVPFDGRPSVEHVQRVSEGEDHYAHNPFSGAGYVKPGLIRKVTVRAALRLLDYGSQHIYNSGSLSGVTTIHFARWILIDEGRRTLFMSNYDGSLESYMSDFIDVVAWGLNLVFSNGVGWPRTRWLIKDGAENEMEFKNFLRSHQLPTQVYYSAYPHLTAVNIGNNTAIRKGLTASSMSDTEARDWLRRF